METDGAKKEKQEEGIPLARLSLLRV